MFYAVVAAAAVAAAAVVVAAAALTGRRPHMFSYVFLCSPMFFYVCLCFSMCGGGRGSAGSKPEA